MKKCFAHTSILLGLMTLPVVAADPLYPADAEVRLLADGFVFTEGPACDPEGNVYFSDVRASKTFRYGTDETLQLIATNTREANGLYFDHDGLLVRCEVVGRRVTRVGSDGSLTTLADQFDGKRLNSPNDLWIDPQGGIYFTDPRYRVYDDLEQDGFHVYYIPGDGKPLRRVLDNLVKPNGIVGTADGRQLYVADHGASKTYRYRILPDGSLTDRALAAPQGSDGMTLDERGNLYLTTDNVDVYNADGEPIDTIDVPGKVTNVCFGGPDRTTLFITANNSLFALQMNVAGN